MNKYPYDTTYNPPIPACNIMLTAPSNSYSVNLTALLDTGADGTIVPVRHLQEIGARRAYEATLRSQWGEPRTVFLYLVDIQIDELKLPGVYVVGDELSNEVVLGRNVLNRLRILLDGPTTSTQFLFSEDF